MSLERLLLKQILVRLGRIEKSLRLSPSCVGDYHVWEGESEWCLCKTRVRTKGER